MKIRNPFDDWAAEDNANRIFREQDYAGPPKPTNDIVERWVPQPDGRVHIIIAGELIAVMQPA